VKELRMRCSGPDDRSAQQQGYAGGPARGFKIGAVLAGRTLGRIRAPAKGVRAAADTKRRRPEPCAQRPARAFQT
jgi:hypothetical protein